MNRLRADILNRPEPIIAEDQMKQFLSAALLLVALTFTAVTIGASDVSANSMSRIIRDLGLTPDDFSMMSASAKPLYDTPSPHPGKVASWTNPDSKSHGKVRLESFRNNCAVLHHVFFPAGGDQSKEIRNRFCKATDGNWLLQP